MLPDKLASILRADPKRTDTENKFLLEVSHAIANAPFEDAQDGDEEAKTHGTHNDLVFKARQYQHIDWEEEHKSVRQKRHRHSDETVADKDERPNDDELSDDELSDDELSDDDDCLRKPPESDDDESKMARMRADEQKEIELAAAKKRQAQRLRFADMEERFSDEEIIGKKRRSRPWVSRARVQRRRLNDGTPRDTGRREDEDEDDEDDDDGDVDMTERTRDKNEDDDVQMAEVPPKKKPKKKKRKRKK